MMSSIRVASLPGLTNEQPHPSCFFSQLVGVQHLERRFLVFFVVHGGGPYRLVPAALYFLQLISCSAIHWYEPPGVAFDQSRGLLPTSGWRAAENNRASSAALGRPSQRWHHAAPKPQKVLARMAIVRLTNWCESGEVHHCPISFLLAPAFQRRFCA